MVENFFDPQAKRNSAPRRLADLIEVGAAASPALIFPDVTLTYGELREASMRWAHTLIGLGVQPGEAVGLLLPTSPEFVVKLFAIAMTGAIAVPINPRYRAQELRHVTADAKLVVILTTDEIVEHVDFAARLREALPSLQTLSTDNVSCVEAPALRQLIVSGPDHSAFSRSEISVTAETIANDTLQVRRQAIDTNDPAIVLYTSGTTSHPKACVISHGAITGSAAAMVTHYDVGPDDRFWCPLPIYHVAGLVPLFAILSQGGPFATLRHFDAGDALALVETLQPTCGFPCYVTILSDLIAHPRFHTIDFSSLRLVNSSPVLLPPALRDTWQQAMPEALQIGTYGMTESVGPACGHRCGDSQALCDAGLGAPFPGWEIKIMASDDDTPVANGSIGEISLRGPRLSASYRSAGTDEWFRTGDLGRVSNGQFEFCGRIKDMLKVGGENVAAAEIESILHEHPSVQLAQVIGVADPRYVEIPIAFIQLQEKASAPPIAELIDFCRSRVASFKIPRDIVFIDEWPMSATKIQKFRLREIYERRTA